MIKIPENCLPFVLIILCLHLPAHAGQTEVSGKQPNFILILSDDQAWSGSSVQMHESRGDSRNPYFETPNLERLAREGVRFSSGYSPAPICTPSRRSIQFGQTPARQKGTRFESDYDPAGNISLPLMLKSIDPAYATAHFGKWGKHMGASPADVGYDESDGNTTNDTGGWELEEQRYTEFTLTQDPKLIHSVTQRANSFIEAQVNNGKPFFVQISHYAVHLDIQTQPDTLERFRNKGMDSLHEASFAAMTWDMDSSVGSILDKVEQLGIVDNTYIIFTSDNGAVTWIPPQPGTYTHPALTGRPSRNQPLRSGKSTLFEGGIRVPFIVKGPDINAGSFCDFPVAGWDLLPTLADLAGDINALPDDIDGGSLKPLLQDACRKPVTRPVAGLVFHSPLIDYPHSAVRAGDYKLIKFWESDELCLYNLAQDPGETKNLARSLPEKSDELHGMLTDYLEQVGANIPPGNYRPVCRLFRRVVDFLGLDRHRNKLPSVILNWCPMTC